MHCGAGPAHWELIQIQKLKKAHRRPDRQTDGQIYYNATQGILPVDWGHMHCASLQAAQNITKKLRIRPDRETVRHRDGDMDRQRHRHIRRLVNRLTIQCTSSERIWRVSPPYRVGRKKNWFPILGSREKKFHYLELPTHSIQGCPVGRPYTEHRRASNFNPGSSLINIPEYYI